MLRHLLISAYLVFSFQQALQADELQEGAWPSQESLQENAPVLVHQRPKNFLPMLDHLYEHRRLYYQLRWSEHSLSWLMQPADDSLVRWLYRLHFPLWKMLSLAPGFDISYASQNRLVTIDELATDIDVKQVSAGLGLRAQASFGRSFFSLAPFVDFSSDLIARSWFHDQDDALNTDTGSAYQRLGYGLNIYFDFGGLSLGLGGEWGKRLHHRESTQDYQSFQVMLRSP